MSKRVGFYRMKIRCDQCLFSKAKIVSDARKEEIIDDCVSTGKHFVCHKASISGKDVACRGFCDEHPGNTLPMRLAESWGLNVDVEEDELEMVAGNGGLVRDDDDEES